MFWARHSNVEREFPFENASKIFMMPSFLKKLRLQNISRPHENESLAFYKFMKSLKSAKGSFSWRISVEMTAYSNSSCVVWKDYLTSISILCLLYSEIWFIWNTIMLVFGFWILLHIKKHIKYQRSSTEEETSPAQVAQPIYRHVIFFLSTV